MRKGLQVGMTLYHLNRRRGTVTQAVVQRLENGSVVVEFEQAVAGFKQVTLPITSIGEWLFFTREDAAASEDSLALRDEYRALGNARLVRLYNSRYSPAARRRSSRGPLLETLQRHGFRGFLHYTDFANFVQIMEDGYLYSRSLVQKSLPCDAADPDVLENTSTDTFEYARFFYRPKTPTLYSNAGIKLGNSRPHMPIPVLLVFRDELIYHDSVLFLDGGGGSHKSTRTADAREALQFDWDAVFRMDGYPGEEKNKRNAEFLYPDKVSTAYLKRIVFRAQPDLDRARLILGENPLYTVDRNQFPDPRYQRGDRNYLCSFVVKPTESEGVFAVIGQFYSDPGAYTHELRITRAGKEKSAQIKPKRLPNGSYLIGRVRRPVSRIAYYMEGHQCGLWEDAR